MVKGSPGIKPLSNGLSSLGSISGISRKSPTKRTLRSFAAKEVEREEELVRSVWKRITPKIGYIESVVLDTLEKDAKKDLLKVDALLERIEVISALTEEERAAFRHTLARAK